MDKMLQWTLRLGQNVTVDVVNLDVTSRQRLSVVIKEAGEQEVTRSRLADGKIRRQRDARSSRLPQRYVSNRSQG